MPGTAKVQFDAGPIVGVRFNSRKHIDDDVVKLLPNRKSTIEAGGFAGVSFHGLTNPYDSLAFRLDVLHGFGSGRNWTNLSPNVEFSTPLSQTTYVSASLGAEWAANKYADYYFTVSPADSLATGGVLPPFNADGGMKNWKAGLLLNQSITGNLLHGFSVFGLGQYSGSSAISSARRSSRSGAARTCGSEPWAWPIAGRRYRRFSSSSTIRSAASSALSSVVSMWTSGASGGSYGLSMPVKFFSCPARALA